MKKIIIALIISITFFGCGVYKTVDLNKLTTGMTKAQVANLIGSPQRILAINQTQNGYQEILEYRTYQDEVYALEFWNDYLVGYEFLYEDVIYVPAPAPPTYWPVYGSPIYPIHPPRPPHNPNPPNVNQPAPPRPPQRPGSNERPPSSGSGERPNTGGNVRPDTRPTERPNVSTQPETPSRQGTTRPAQQPSNTESGVRQGTSRGTETRSGSATRESAPSNSGGTRSSSTRSGSNQR